MIIAFFVAIFSGCGYKADPYYSSADSALDSRNSLLGAPFADLANFECSQTSSLVSHSKFAKNHKTPTAISSVVVDGVEL